MKCMVIVKASKNSEKGVMPSAELLAAMGKYNEELIKAGIMKGGGGLMPTSQGKRVRFPEAVTIPPFLRISRQAAVGHHFARRSVLVRLQALSSLVIPAISPLASRQQQQAHSSGPLRSQTTISMPALPLIRHKPSN